MGHSCTKEPSKRRGIYLPVRQETDLIEYAERHGMTFNAVVRLAGETLLELESRGANPKFSVEIPADFQQ